MAGGLKVFISYRRTDAVAYAGRIYDTLSQRFGHDNVFMDIDSIALGQDFVDVIEERLNQSAVMLVLIGPGWVNATDAQGNRRLDDPHDFPRLEVERGLARAPRLLVIPVLVGGAMMPTTDQLPPSMSMLTRRNAASLIDVHWSSTMSELMSALDRVGEQNGGSAPPSAPARSPSRPMTATQNETPSAPSAQTRRPAPTSPQGSTATLVIECSQTGGNFDYFVFIDGKRADGKVSRRSPRLELKVAPGSHAIGISSNQKMPALARKSQKIVVDLAPSATMTLYCRPAGTVRGLAIARTPFA